MGFRVQRYTPAVTNRGTALRMQRINGSADASKDTDAPIRDGESAQRNGTARYPGK